MKVNFKLIGNGKLPETKTTGAACLDAYSRVHEVINPYERKLIPLGFAVELPEDYEMVIRPRSSLTKNYIDGAIGTIDSDYRGEVFACLINNSDFVFTVNENDRIAQLAIRRAPKIKPVVVTELSDTLRGVNGFGSTGV